MMITLPSDPYEAVIDHFPNGVLVLFDAELRYRIVGPQFLPFSNRRAAAMVGKTIHELFPPETAARLEPELQATIVGSPRSFDIQYADQTHHIETEPVTLDGVSFGVLVTQDVTAERETKAALERQTKRLESVAYLLSHDLRNPLATAQGYLEIERENRGSSESLETVERALDRIARIIDDLMDIARANNDSLEPTVVDVSAVAVDAWEMVASSGATVRVELDAIVHADRSRLQRVFENLFRNAVEHGGTDVVVTVGELPDGFYIEDDGPGIPAEHRSAVFDFGFSTSEGGTGFGLNIVESVVTSHGWDIRVTESAAGGARFEITSVEFQ